MEKSRLGQKEMIFWNLMRSKLNGVLVSLPYAADDLLAGLNQMRETNSKIYGNFDHSNQRR